MKLLIIAGPYEADRLRRSAVAAGFETVAVEPGESLSGWITASRPRLIVMAPQMVHPDPALAIAKVRSVPRGRVPILLVGDEEDEPRMSALCEGFFVRPVSPEALLAHAKAVLSAEQGREATRVGPDGAQPPRPAGARATVGLKPLVASAIPPVVNAVATPLRSGSDPAALSAELDAGMEAGIDAGIDADIDADIDTLLDAELNHPLAVEPKNRASVGPPGDARARILAHHALVQSGDYFQVLGLPREATAAEVEAAHARLIRELDPEALGPALGDELRVELDAVREVAGEALRILKDDRLRARYCAQLAP